MEHLRFKSRASPESDTNFAAALRRRWLARALAVVAIGALCLAALVAIGIFLFGEFGETEGRLLGTAVSVAGYSLLGMASSTLLGRPPRWLGPLGLGVAAVGFCLMVTLIWASPDDSLLARVTTSVLFVSVAISHAALLVLLRVDGPPARVVLRATLAVTPILTAMIVVPILFALEPGEFYYRLLGVVAVLAVLGTLLVPILRKVESGRAGADLARPTQPGTHVEGDFEMEVRFRGRRFVVRAAGAASPAPSFESEAWEIVGARRLPIANLPRPGRLADPHAALALAVLQVARTVDGGVPEISGQDPERAATGAAAVLRAASSAQPPVRGGVAEA